MKEILVSKNRPCLCNSTKKFKECCGLNISNEVTDTYKIYFLLRDIYSKSFTYIKKNYSIESYLEDFRIYNNVPDENKTNFEQSFKFIEFVIFKSINKETKEPFSKELLKNPLLDNKEKAFLEELVRSSFFSIFKITNYDFETGYIKMVNIFTNKEYEWYNKIFNNLQEGGLIYGRYYLIFSRNGLLPTINVKETSEIKEKDLEKNIKAFTKRYENEKEDNEKLTMEGFINSIEYELYGGDNPYAQYELDERFEEFKKKNPGKDFDDFLDEIENELLELE